MTLFCRESLKYFFFVAKCYNTVPFVANIKILYFLSRNIKIRYSLLRNIKIRAMSRKNGISYATSWLHILFSPGALWHPPTDTFSPIVGNAYPIQMYILENTHFPTTSNCHIFNWHIFQYKRIFLKMHIPQPPTIIYPPNTNIHIPKPCGWRAHGHPPTDTYPPYPIPVYIQTAYILQFCIIYNVYIQHEYIYK